jgi:hypothetical protein
MAALGVGVLAYAWVAAGLRPFTWPQRVMIGTAGTAVLALAAHWSGRRLSLSRWWASWRLALRRDADPRWLPGRRPLRWRTGVAVWGSLIAAVVVWELIMLFSSPRSAHPTLSAIIDPILRDHLVRFLALLAWLVLGLELARR